MDVDRVMGDSLAAIIMVYCRLQINPWVFRIGIFLVIPAISHLICSYEHTRCMSPPPGTPSDGRPESPARQYFLQRLDALAIKPAARDYYVRWAESWTKARGNRSAAATSAFFDALGRSTHLHNSAF